MLLKRLPRVQANGVSTVYLTTQPTIALVEDTNFRFTFEAAGRRLNQLDDQAQVCSSSFSVPSALSPGTKLTLSLHRSSVPPCSPSALEFRTILFSSATAHLASPTFRNPR